MNKVGARSALAKVLFFYRLGEISDRSFEQQLYRASGLNLITAACVLWNTVYLERATATLQNNGREVYASRWHPCLPWDGSTST